MRSPLPRLVAGEIYKFAAGKTIGRAMRRGKRGKVDEYRRSAAPFERFRCRMGGRWDVALARFCCASCMAIMLPAAGARSESGPLTACRFEPAGAAKVRAVSDGRSFILEDGREIRLVGIEVPLPPAAGESGPNAEAALAVRAALAAIVVDQTVELRHNGAPADRYGRTLALAYVGGADARRSVAHGMLARGFARVAAHIGDRACAEELLREERAARRAKLGLWSEPYYAIVVGRQRRGACGRA